MLSLLLLFFLFKGIGTVAVPNMDPLGEPSSTAAARDGLQGRTMFNIVWGCLSTTFICTWVSVHPNIPPPKYEEYGWRSLARRMWLMFWALVAPELILFWSFRQWTAAGKIARVYNERNESQQATVLKTTFFGALGKCIKDWSRGRLSKEELESTVWTRTHGHLVVMGGIVLLQPEDEGVDTQSPSATTQLPNRKPTETIVDISMFKELVKDPKFKIDITEEEINDKAKGDFLTKTITFLQVSWFITQCIARFVQGLGVTELEVVTLALASMNGVVYVFWSSKPLGLQVPIRIRSERKVEAEHERMTNGRILRELLPDSDSLGEMEDAFTTFCVIIIFLLISPVLVPLAIIYLLFLFLAALADVTLTNTIPQDATHVPAFYSPKTESGFSSLLLLLPFFGSMFGGLHCLAWNFTYPTRAERTIWRVASLTITLTPPGFMILFLLLGALGNFARRHRGEGIQKSVWTVMEWTMLTIAVLPVTVYVLARLVLLVEAVALLRRQPENAFQAIVWTKFLPHV